MFPENPLATDLVKDCVDVLAAVQGHVDHLRQVVHVESKCGSIYNLNSYLLFHLSIPSSSYTSHYYSIEALLLYLLRGDLKKW